MTLLQRITDKLTFLIGSSYRIGKVFTFTDYSRQFPGKIELLTIEKNRSAMVCRANYIGKDYEQAYSIHLPDSYMCHFADGSIIGASSVILSKSGHILYDMLAERKKYGANMTDMGLCLIGGKPRHFGEHFIISYQKNSAQVLDKGISLACNMSNNYYHFMFEVVSRFYLLSKVQIEKDVPILIDEVILGVPQMVEILNALNVDNRKIIPVRRHVLYKVKDLYILSKPHIVTPNSVKNGVFTENFAFDTNALAYVRDLLTSRYNSTFQTRNIFLSRKQCNKRNCNEDELLPILKKHEINIVYTDGISIAEQINLFKSAGLIIGASGAAFTNLLFAPQGAQVIIFMPTEVNISCFTSLASALGIQSICIADKTPNKSIHASFSIKPAELDVTINNLKMNKYSW